VGSGSLDGVKNPGNLRDALILAYMVGNAMTFTKVISEGANSYGAEAFAERLINALALSVIWPFYWFWRTAVG
jgi:hypothetical protein